ncbi:hypothetical protein J6590_103603 [Homalodisca vitripennis]|nr:hypothetical protein J6590_103603 [Homalodisca vitripennis]
MDNLHTSEIDRELDNHLIDSSDGESDIGAEDVPSDFDLLDFSSGSEEEYVPDIDEMETSDREDVTNDPPSPLMPRPTTPQNIPVLTPWLRAYPPEPELDIGPNFRLEKEFAKVSRAMILGSK